MYAAYQADGPIYHARKATTCSVSDSFEEKPSDLGRDLAGRIMKYCVAGTFGLLSPIYLHASAATSNWTINQIKINGQSDNSAGAISNSAQDIEHIRAIMKISVSELSRVFGVSRQSVHDWIKGGTPSSRNAQRLSELARATDVFLETKIDVSPQIFRRKIAGGTSILDAVREDGDLVDLAKTLAATLARESQQRKYLATRLAGRSATSVSDAEIGSPHLNENV